MSSNSDDSLGFGFYAKLAGLILAIGIGVFIAFLIFARAVYAWGFLGAFLVISDRAAGVRVDLRSSPPERLTCSRPLLER